MSKSDLKVGDKVVCILDQRFKGKVVGIHRETLGHQYEVEFDKDVPCDSNGALFFAWQLKRIEEEETECLTDITENVTWKTYRTVGGYCLQGYHHGNVICGFAKHHLVIHDRGYKTKYSPGDTLFSIFKKDC